MRYYFVWLFIVSLNFCGCKKEPEQPAAKLPSWGENKVLVSCEGIFPRGNASLSLIDLGSGKVWDDVYFQANQRRLGDVLQSITFRNGKAYCVVNNSSKIEVLDLTTWKSVQTKGGLGSPRYLHFTGDGNAWLTDLFGNRISILDETSLVVKKTISVPFWTEQIVQQGDTLYITSPQREKLYLASVSAQTLIDSIEMPGKTLAILNIKGKIWVSCQVSEQEMGLAKVMHGRLTSFSRCEGKPGLSFRLQSNGAGDTLYFLSKDLYWFPTLNPPATIPIYLSGQGKNYYSLGVHPKTGHVFVADAIDFQQKGRIAIFVPGAQTPYRSFLTGLIPGQLYFF